jgi:glycosyltransferase involved in cell wall biosynthesis
MKIAILGTRGIPNNYGGFEQFAEIVSQYWLGKGHEIWVYCSHKHNFNEPFFKGVNRIEIFDPEYFMGTSGQFIYDFNCILDSRKIDFDVILQLGYTSSSIWGFLLPKKPLIVTNMDGLEWKRTKFSRKVQTFLKWAEKLAIRTSDILVADSIGIQSYLKIKHSVESQYIAYGSEIPEIENHGVVLFEYGVSEFEYNLLIARMEPENNIEMILEGIVKSGSERITLVVGKTENAFGQYLVKKFQQPFIRFLGGIYDKPRIDALRKYAYLYYHGHSVGGTNPSLLEAMAVGALISANDNEFNKSVLNQDAFYFQSKEDVANQQNMILNLDRDQIAKNCINKVRTDFNWDKISGEYLHLFERGLAQRVKS